MDSFVIEHNAFPADLEATGFEASSQYVESVMLDSSGVIRLAVQAPPVEGEILFTRIDDATWQCSGEGIDEKYLLVECR